MAFREQKLPPPKKNHYLRGHRVKIPNFSILLHRFSGVGDFIIKGTYF